MALQWFSIFALIYMGSLFLLQAMTGVSSNRLMSVYEQEYDTSQYIYATGLPDLTQLTLCVWIHSLNDNFRSKSIFSISGPYTDNEFWVSFTYGRKMKLGISASYWYSMQDPVTQADLELLFYLHWEYHCFTWKSGELFKWYNDMNNPNSMTVYQSLSTAGHTVRGSGNLVMLQDQDSILGGFQLGQLLESKIAGVSMWDYELDENQINSLNCGDDGNLVKMDDLQYSTEAATQFSTVTCDVLDPGNEENTNQQICLMCKVVGARLATHIIQTVTARSQFACVIKCSHTTECLSVNYYQTQMICELNNAVESAINLLSLSEFDYLHPSSNGC